MEWIFSWVKSGLLFGIFASVILMLCPNKAYQKHVGLVVGMLFLLVMLHPLMELFQVDGSTYVSYIRNFLMLETGEGQITDSELELYEESIAIQLTANLKEAGYPIKRVLARAEENGEIQEITLSFDGEPGALESLEKYLRELFGKEVVISYAYR